jgi:hypothetical protein
MEGGSSTEFLELTWLTFGRAIVCSKSLEEGTHKLELDAQYRKIGIPALAMLNLKASKARDVPEKTKNTEE